MYLTKLENFVHQRTLSRKGKDNPQNWGKYLFASLLFDKGLVFRIMNSSESTTKKKEKSVKTSKVLE